jgi:crotonobetainyl-CoA:carnitine CoA-transferase CaiB-like acyl-CoA transferase
MLSGYRALDLTDCKGWFCGRILADLGVDVIKVEPPEGDQGRSREPFIGGEKNIDRSLRWFAYNLGKRGVTLNLETEEGKEIFRRLAKKSDFVLESFPPGIMEKMGLSYGTLKEINSGIIFTSISPFGKDGPYRDYKATDIVAMAMGGFMYLTGDPDRPPLRVSLPVAYALASTQAALGSLIAFHHRRESGLGQYVDVSVQESVVNTLTNALPTWELNGILTRRVGPFFFRGGLGQEAHQRVIWGCRDGAVAFMAMGGMVGARSNRALVKWMDEEGLANDFLRAIDWNAFDTVTMSKGFHQQFEESVAPFFKAHTRKELHEGAQQRGIFLQLLATPKDIMESQQLGERQFWVDVFHPELGKEVRYPGAFVKASESPLRLGPRAPSIGEHNTDIYQGDLGFSAERIEELKRKGVI